MPPKRDASPKDDQTPKRRDEGQSPPPRPPPLESSPSVSPASSASSDLSVTEEQLSRMSVRELSPDTMGSLRAAGIPHDPTQHPNYDQRTRRAYLPEYDPLSAGAAGAAVRVLPLPPRRPLPPQMRRIGLSDQQLQANQALIDARNEARIARDRRINWLNPNGQLVAGAVDGFRYWGQYTNEVVLVLPPSSLMMWLGGPPVECYVTVEELQEEIRDLHCRALVPPPPSHRRQFGDDDHEIYHGNGGPADDDDDDVPVAPREILDVYLRFLRNYGLGPFSSSDDFKLWEYRSMMRRTAGRDRMDDLDHIDALAPPPQVLRMTFYDIEVFVRRPPMERNLQEFIEAQRSVWLRRQSDPDDFGLYCQYRDDLRFEGEGARDAFNAEFASDGDTGSDRSDGSMGPFGGKRRKPATKRKARRSASSKRKPAASKRRRTTKKASRRRRRSTRRH